MIKLNNSVRRELKYKVFTKDIGKLYSWIYNRSFKKKFEPRGVNSLYYDTANLNFANDNIDGLSRRLKVRARWYSDVNENFLNKLCNENTVINFEIKRKVNNFSDKIILPKIFLSNQASLIERKKFLHSNLKKKISEYKDLSNFFLHDNIFVGYKREYYIHSFISDIRITIDKEINTLICNNKSHQTKKNISNDFIIVEIKCSKYSTNYLKEVIHTFPFRQIRFSKYLFGLSKYYSFSY